MLELLHEIADFALAIRHHWQAYMTGGIVLAVVGLWERLTKKTVSIRSVVIGVIAFFVAASFMAWSDQHQATQDALLRLDATTKPQLSLEFEFLHSAPSGKDSEDSIILITADIFNTGVPSIAKGFDVRVRLPNGREVIAEQITVPDRESYTDNAGRPLLSLRASELLPLAAISAPIPSGGAVHGFFKAFLRRVKQQEFWNHGTELIVSFSDVTNRPYSARIQPSRLTRSAELPVEKVEPAMPSKKKPEAKRHATSQQVPPLAPHEAGRAEPTQPP